MIRLIPGLLILLLCLETSAQQAVGQTQWDWEFQVKGADEWYPASVPGNVFDDLQRVGRIPDPFYGTNEDSVQWVSGTAFVYRTKPFTLDPGTPEYSLRFPGIDGPADIFLNDTHVLTCDNFFRSWETGNIRPYIKSGMTNVIRIEFHAPSAYTKKAAESYGLTPPGDERVFLRKPPFQWGWDWGPKLAGVGIFRKPEIIAWKGFMLEKPLIETIELEDHKAILKANFRIRSNHRIRVTLKLLASSLQGEEIWLQQKVLLRKGTHDYSFTFEVKDPNLWWTHDQGEPFLYHCTAEILSRHLPTEKIKTSVGIRLFELKTEADSLGNEFSFQLNHRPVFMKGANYIPQHPFPHLADTGFRVVRDAAEANMNMLRVWGGGWYETDAFYELCDSLGIAVWQDFMFACAMYPGTDDFLKNIKEEAAQQVRRISAHPCVALWCGNNEISEGWARWGWKDGMSASDQQRLTSAYDQIFKKILPREVRSRCALPYWESSPMLGRGDVLHTTRGDAHYWGVWHDAEPFGNFRVKIPRFMSEFGFQSLPEPATLREIIPDSALYEGSAPMLTHQKHPRGDKLMHEYIDRWYPQPADIQQYAYFSQLTQAYGIRMGIEAHRRARPYCMGTLYWQLNDCWPVASWSSIDHTGRWKALHYQAKRCFEPVQLSVLEEAGKVQVYASNDLPTEQKVSLEIALIHFNGDTLYRDLTGPFTLKAGSSERLFSAYAAPFTDQYQKSQILLSARLIGTEALDHAYVYHYFENPASLDLQADALIVQTSREGNETVLSLRSNWLVKDIFVETGCPGKLSDNAFDLLPGTEVQIRFTPPPELSDCTLNILHLGRYIGK